jgi:hypothetical protein
MDPVKKEPTDLMADALQVISDAKPYVEKATIERDFSAYPILARINSVLKAAADAKAAVAGEREQVLDQFYR